MTSFDRSDDARFLRPPRLRTLEEADGRHASYLDCSLDATPAAET